MKARDFISSRINTYAKTGRGWSPVAGLFPSVAYFFLPNSVRSREELSGDLS